jgi:hypothetical protein
VKKKFVFRFKLVHEVTLDEDQIYPDYPWHLAPEHSRAYRRGKRMRALDAAAVMKTVRAAGGAVPSKRPTRRKKST